MRPISRLSSDKLSLQLTEGLSQESLVGVSKDAPGQLPLHSRLGVAHTHCASGVDVRERPEL